MFPISKKVVLIFESDLPLITSTNYKMWNTLPLFFSSETPISIHRVWEKENFKQFLIDHIGISVLENPRTSEFWI